MTEESSIGYQLISRSTISNMMKVLFLTLLSISLTLAIPPPFPQRYTTLGRQQSPPPASAPLRSFGRQPQVLPARQTAPAAPSPSYGPPAQVYGPPKDVYGPPTTTELVTTTDIDFTEEPEAERFKVRPLNSQRQTAAETVERGQYYLLLPDGRLQKVQYVTSADLQRMAYSAKLRYEDVEPISGPIFSTANNQPFVPIFQKK